MKQILCVDGIFEWWGHLGLLEKDGYPKIHEGLCEVDDIFPGHVNEYYNL